MNIVEATKAKELGQQVAVLYSGARGQDIKSGVIVAIKKKLRSGRVWSYATVRWSTPTCRGDASSDVLVGRVRSIQRLLEGC